MKRLVKRGAALLMSGILLVTMVFVPVPAAEIDTVSAERDGDNIRITVEGNTWYFQGDVLTFQYPDGSEETLKVCIGQDNSSIKTRDWSDVEGVSIEADYENNGDYLCTILYPIDLLSEPGASLEFAGHFFSTKELGLEEESLDSQEDTLPEDRETLTEQSEDEEGKPSEEEADPEEEKSHRPAEPAGDRVSAKITVDGNLKDWKNVPELSSGDSKVDWWKIAQNQDGDVYFCFTGTAVSQWDSSYNYKTFTLSQQGKNKSYQIKTGSWDISSALDATVVTNNLANGNTGAPYYVEAMIPASSFSDPEFSITFGEVTVPASSIPVLTGKDTGEKEMSYHGITIDGEFEDWDSVVKGTENLGCNNSSHPQCLGSEAVVFDGAYLYIYLEEAHGRSAAGAGSHSNGRYALTSDLGRTLFVQLSNNNGGSVLGVKGAQASHVGSQWEIAIPTSALPQYEYSFDFGFYLLEPFHTEIVNLSGESGDVTPGSFSGIVYDGSYGDWDDYPHTLIEYATPGTQTLKTAPDGEAALYATGTMLYGHLITEYEPHVEAKGYDLANALSIAFNGERNYKANPEEGNLYPAIVGVDGAGNIDYNPQFEGLSKGNHEFYIMDKRSWKSTTNINELKGNDHLFGRMTMTIGDSACEMEFEIDLEEVAAYIGCDASDFKLIEAQFGRIGQQWVSTAGISSGPWLGVGLCVACVGGIGLWQGWKRKK